MLLDLKLTLGVIINLSGTLQSQSPTFLCARFTHALHADPNARAPPGVPSDQLSRSNQGRKLGRKCISSLRPPLPAHFRPLHPGSWPEAFRVTWVLLLWIESGHRLTAKMPVRLRAPRAGSRAGPGPEERREARAGRSGGEQTAALLCSPVLCLQPQVPCPPRCLLPSPAVFPDPTREPRSQERRLLIYF